MDVKTQFIHSVVNKLYPDFTQGQLQLIEQTLHIKLNKYDIVEKTTDIVPYVNNIKPLQNFLVSKLTQGLSKRTIEHYEYYLNKLLDSMNKDLSEITSFDIRAFLMNYKTQNCISNRTLENMRLCFSAFFTWLFNEKLIPDNPCASVAPIKFDTTIKHPFTKSEIEKLKCACETKRDRALIEFLCATGCRVSEIVALNRDSVNFTTNTVLVFGKGNKERFVYLSQIAMMYLFDYLNSRSDLYPALFVGRNTERLTINGIEHALKRLGKKAGVEDVYPHRFRRTFATNLLDYGADIQDVAQLLGHNDIKTTQIYCYITQSNVKATYDKYMA